MPWIQPNPAKTSFYVKDRDENGKPFHIDTFYTRSDAEACVEKLKALKKKTAGGFDYQAGKLPFRDYVEKWRDDFAVLKRGYQASDRFVIKAMLAPDSTSKSLMDKPISNIHEDDIEDWLDIRRDDGISESTLRRQFTYIQNVFKTCRVKWKMRWLSDPTVDVEKPKGDKARSRRVNKAERARLIDVAEKYGPRYLALAIEFALETAMRQGEIAGAKISDCDPEHKTLHLASTKNGSQRTVPLTDRAVKIIELAKETCKNEAGLIFGVSSNGLKIAWQRTITEERGFHDIRFHDLRHERTSRMFEEGRLDMVEIMAITGHKTHSCLLRYTHLNGRHLGVKMRGEQQLETA